VASGVGAVMLVVGLPELALNRTLDVARACFETFERGPTPPDDPCTERAERWSWLARRTPWVKRRAELVVEELHARLAVARFVDAAVGSLEDEELESRFRALESAATELEKGSARLRLDELGPPMSAPRPAHLAAQLGARRILDAHALSQTAHDVQKHAIAGALLEANTARAVELAAHAHGHANKDLRVLAGALDCLAKEPHSEASLVEVASTRAAKRTANFYRNYGDARVVLEACARLRGTAAPPPPTEDDAGKLDRFEQRMALALRRWADECDPGHVVPSAPGAMAPCREGARASRALTDVRTRLGERVPLAYRLELIALLAPAFDDGRALLRLARPQGGAERSHLERLSWAIDEWVSSEGSDEPYVMPRAYDAAASRVAELAAAGDPDKELATLAVVLRMKAARAHALIGDGARAEEALEGALVELAPLKGQAQLARSSLAWLLGKLDAALTALDPAAIGAPADRAAVRLQRAVLLLPDVKLSEAELRAALVDLGAGASSLAATELATRVRWWLVALGGADASLPAPVDAEATPSVGLLAGMPPEVRATKHAVALGIWQTWLAAPETAHRELRYRALRARGDAPRDALAASLILGGKLAPSAKVERWLDAFFALDAGRIPLSYQAWLRHVAAQARGDRVAATTWRARFDALARLANHPAQAELWRIAGL